MILLKGQVMDMKFHLIADRCMHFGVPSAINARGLRRIHMCKLREWQGMRATKWHPFSTQEGDFQLRSDTAQTFCSSLWIPLLQISSLRSFRLLQWDNKRRNLEVAKTWNRYSPN